MNLTNKDCYLSLQYSFTLKILKKIAFNRVSLIFMFCCFYTVAFCQEYRADWQSLDKRAVPEWYKDAKFGVFIVWGVYSVPAYSTVGQYAEWYQHSLLSKPNGAVAKYHKEKYDDMTYYQLAKYFKAVLFNPDDWAQLIEKSGAKYVVFTAKFHDGFCLWPNKKTEGDWKFPWNSTEIGPKRDLVGELFTALRRTDVRPGLYYSLYEWYNPLYLKSPEEFAVKRAIPQMKDLINNYKPYVLWTDGDWEQSDSTWHSAQFLSWLYNDSPMKDSIVTYDRWGKGIRFRHGSIYTPEYQPDLPVQDRYFEESQGMGYSYGYNQAEDASDYSSAHLLTLQLIDIVSNGGNFLLDIGPNADGKIPPIMQERLLQIGRWLSVNGEAIYDTRPWNKPFQWSAGIRNYKSKTQKEKLELILKQTVDPDPGYAVKEMFFTYKDHNLYCILPFYPKSSKMVIRDFSLKENKRSAITFLSSGQELEWTDDSNNVTITMPVFDPEKMKGPFVLKISGVPGPH